METSFKYILTVAIIALCFTGAGAQVAGNPPFKLDQAVVAAGGGTSTTNVYKIEGTIAQPVAGKTVSNASYTIRSGFFTPPPFGATAALAKISGRVTTFDGRGIRNVTILLSNGGGSLPRSARTSSFGYFTFEDVPVGEVYILTIRPKQFRFSQNSQVISLFDDVTDISFIADEL
ncbi:MAG: carboxypeptidase-like regulatory domain-containing protein [Pyrinomonadaceae bacterium]